MTKLSSAIIILLLLASCKKAPPPPVFGEARSVNVDDGEDESDDGTEYDDSDATPSDEDEEETDDVEDKPEDEEESGNDPPASDDGKPKVPDAFAAAIDKVEVKSAGGQAAVKGETTVFKVNLKNAGSKSGKIKLTPFITAKGFDDYENIKLGSFEVSLGATESKTAEFKIDPFFKEEGGNREYALNKANYTLKFQVEGDLQQEWKDFNGKDFAVGGSNAVFTAVYWSQPYLDKARYGGSIDDWLRESFTRKGQTSNGANLFASYNGGFDQMMGVKTMWKTFANWRPNQNEMGRILEQVSEEGQRRLGLKQPFQNHFDSKRMTHTANHGYDMEIGLTENGFGGVAWLGGNTQASGIFDGDPSIGRSQMVLIHETGHNYGSDHCDPIQGFVMCSGEKHDHYTNGDQWFVWHDVSIAQMTKAKNMSAESLGFGAFSLSGNKPRIIHD